MLHQFAFGFLLKLIQWLPTVTNNPLLHSPVLSCSKVFACLMPEIKFLILILEERKFKFLKAESTYQSM